MIVPTPVYCKDSTVLPETTTVVIPHRWFRCHIWSLRGFRTTGPFICDSMCVCVCTCVLCVSCKVPLASVTFCVLADTGVLQYPQIRSDRPRRRVDEGQSACLYTAHPVRFIGDCAFDSSYCTCSGWKQEPSCFDCSADTDRNDQSQNCRWWWHC